MPLHVPFLLHRRSLLAAGLAAPWLGACTAPVAAPKLQAAQAELTRLESEVGGRLGVAAFDGRTPAAALLHRADERFPMCSTFKVIAAAGVLARSVREPDLLARRIRYTREELVSYSPVTEKRVAEGMTVAELCAAALQYSDNTAGNLLIRLLGDPAGVTRYARSLGDEGFRLDRWETALNEALPGDPRDTTTPASMARSLHRLLLQDGLPEAQRARLEAWMRGNTTGATRIQAGVPAGWAVADKTGAGAWGTTNDVGVVWRPDGSALVMAIYLAQPRADAPMRNDLVAAAARIAAQALTP
ncbi:class A beta-lactamase [Xenophilus sp. Marseille-Q4582]|uniref:class A beta-lactamase n=1 Tax=Xenophilus sp. Marseille-Q4582 TaxID=2866600 RepID=UPI001CE41D6C|nr:class A beta-lactamase [Xenophilus sp. Marseille-Q4582]